MPFHIWFLMAQKIQTLRNNLSRLTQLKRRNIVSRARDGMTWEMRHPIVIAYHEYYPLQYPRDASDHTLIASGRKGSTALHLILYQMMNDICSFMALHCSDELNELCGAGRGQRNAPTGATSYGRAYCAKLYNSVNLKQGSREQ